MPDHLCQTADGGNYADVASAAKAHPAEDLLKLVGTTDGDLGRLHQSGAQLCLAKMSSARNRAHTLAVKTPLGSCASPDSMYLHLTDFKADCYFGEGQADPLSLGWLMLSRISGHAISLTVKYRVASLGEPNV